MVEAIDHDEIVRVSKIFTSLLHLVGLPRTFSPSVPDLPPLRKLLMMKAGVVLATTKILMDQSGAGRTMLAGMGFARRKRRRPGGAANGSLPDEER